MERSLTVPTATSFRNVPARLLEVNRKAINAYMTRGGMGKVSFTHLIGYAIVRAIADSVPASEWQETQNKARALLRAAEMAEAGLDTRLD